MAETVVSAVALSLPGAGSAVVEVTVAVLLSTVPLATPAPTWTVTVKTALPTAKVAAEQETVPLAPTAGVVQLHPAGAETDWKVVPAGSGSSITALEASSGPLLLTVMV